MRILVTGATGFIGNVLCSAAVKKGFSVVAVVRKNSDFSKLPSSVELVEITSLGFLLPPSALVGVDAVVHLAARVHVMADDSPDPLKAYRQDNLETTMLLAQQAADARISRFVYLSSIKVNGEGGLDQHIPYDETSAIPSTLDPYGQSKWEAEQNLLAFSSQNSLDITIIRPPLVYGPGVKANFQQLIRLVDTFPVIPLGGINNSRSLIYVENLVDAILTSLGESAAKNQTFLVSDGDSVSTSDLILKIAVHLKKNPLLVKLPKKALALASKLINKPDIAQRLAGSLMIDSKKIRGDLNWSPPFTIDEGLSKTIDWYKKNKSGTSSR
jgi:nucleoside-diphosphate-sugar epimerase